MSDNPRFDTENYEFNSDSKTGVYLIHGFTNTTYEVKKLSNYLSKDGYHIIAENLPGHGTNVEECNRVKYADWISSVKEGVAKLSTTCDKIHIIGISMGAVLAMQVATIFPINSIIIVAPVLQFQNQFKARFLLPLLNKLIPFTSKASQYSNSKNMKFYGYEYYPNKALNEFRKLTNIVRKNLDKVKAPTLMIFSESDKTCIMENHHIIKNEIGSDIKESLILNQLNHVMLDDTDHIDEHKLLYSTIKQFLKRF